MDELVKTFHIDIKLMLAQVVNFSIVLFVLYKFAYGPILKNLNSRTDKIEKGIKDAQEATTKLTEMEKKEKEVLTQAKEESQKIINQAEETARKSKELIATEAKAQSEKILADAQRRIEEEKGKMLAEVKAEIAGLVVLATEKILHEKIDTTKDSELINKAIQ
jgi:F-type H+-transporting ATPase subunit b